MCKLYNKNILITGAASGIGKLLAEISIEKGCNKLILLDLDKYNLDLTAKALKVKNKNIFTFKIDLSKKNEIVKISKQIKNKIGNIDILINNAGIVVGKKFVEHSHAEIQKTIEINSNALMHLTLEFLPEMISRGCGHIVNISSAAGFSAMPKMSVYVASKHAVVGWSESLRIEMEKGKTGVHITTVTPYYINTGMFAGVKSLIPLLDQNYVVNKIISGIEKNKIFVKLPFLVKIQNLIKGLLPTRIYDFIVGDLLRVYSTMDNFIGRKKMN